MTDRDTTWTIGTESHGSLEFDGAIGASYPTFGAGKSVSLRLYSRTITDTSIDTLREFARYTTDDTIETGTDLRGSPWYYESINPIADIESMLVLVEPGEAIESIEEWWCVITDVELVTTSAGTSPRLDVELFALGTLEEYANRERAENEFESEVAPYK